MIEKKATKQGNKFIIENKEESFETVVAEAINRIERFLNLDETDFSKFIK